MIPARRGKIYPRPRATSPRTVRVYLALVVRVRALACNTRLDAKFQLFLLLPLRYCSFYFRLFPPPSLSLSRSHGWRWFFSHVSTKILSLCVFLLSAHFPLPFSPCVKLDFTLGFRNPRHTRLQHVSFYLFFFFFSFYRSRFTGNRHFFSSFLRCCIIIYVSCTVNAST